MFIGEKEVDESATKTHDLVADIVYKDGSTETMTSLMFNASLSEDPLDATSLRDHQLVPIVKAVISLLLDYDVHASDVQYVTALTITSLQEWEKAADKVKWQGLDKRHIKISDIDKTLKGQ